MKKKKRRRRRSQGSRHSKWHENRGPWGNIKGDEWYTRLYRKIHGATTSLCNVPMRTTSPSLRIIKHQHQVCECPRANRQCDVPRQSEDSEPSKASSAFLVSPNWPISFRLFFPLLSFSTWGLIFRQTHPPIPWRLVQRLEVSPPPGRRILNPAVSSRRYESLLLPNESK